MVLRHFFERCWYSSKFYLSFFFDFVSFKLCFFIVKNFSSRLNFTTFLYMRFYSNDRRIKKKKKIKHENHLTIFSHEQQKWISISKWKCIQFLVKTKRISSKFLQVENIANTKIPHKSCPPSDSERLIYTSFFHISK